MRLRKAFVLAGGFGSRLKHLTKDTPKPLVELQGRPILDYTFELFRRFGVKEVMVSIHYLGEKIVQRYGDGSRIGMKIRYITEDEPLGTGGALRLAGKWLDEPFVMCNADELKDINLERMFKQHVYHGSAATIALTEVDDPSQYGVVDLCGNRIVDFVEKPKREEAPSNMINAGLYILDPRVIEFLPGGFCMVEKDLFPKIAQLGELYGFLFRGQWFDTGTQERLELAKQAWKGFTQWPGGADVRAELTSAASGGAMDKYVDNQGVGRAREMGR